MARMIRLRIGSLELTGELDDTPTASAIWQALPLERTVSAWGDELYFDIGVDAELEAHATDVVPVGTLAYWPPGTALCIFFGRTPVSQGDEPRAASAVNVVGRLDETPVEDLRQIADGTPVTIESAT